ncbi:MAG TPA: pantetheine-phosphate adenylyltransferase [Alphaproteobacteria bacterium]
MTDPRTGIYPGTFDPTTVGHLDIIRRALRVVDKVVIGVAVNAGKAPMFEIGDRVAMLREAVAAMDHDVASRVSVTAFDNLLIHFASQQGAGVIIRGLRAVSDFEYEFQMAGMNARLAPDIETVFLMASEGIQFIASRLVKEIYLLGGDVTQFVPPNVARRLDDHISRQIGGTG